MSIALVKSPRVNIETKVSKFLWHYFAQFHVFNKFDHIFKVYLWDFLHYSQF